MIAVKKAHMKKIKLFAADKSRCKLFFLVLTLLLIAVFMLGCETPTVSRDDLPIDTGEADGFSYNIYEGYVGLIDCTLDSGRLDIPSKLSGLPVAKLEDGFLQSKLDNYSSVSLPDSIVYIGEHALSCEKGDIRLTIPKGVQYIGCGALSGVDLGDDEFVIVGKGILVHCNGDSEDVRLPNGVRLISSAFESNKSVRSVKVNKGCTELAASAFAFSSVREVWLPDSVEVIGSDCFRKSELESIRMPSGDCTIGKFAFEGISELILTLTEQSSAYLYAIENDLDFCLEGGDGNIFGADRIKAVGIGEHELSIDGEVLDIELSERDISEDGCRAALLLNGDENGKPARLVYADLRTLRATDVVLLERDVILSAFESYTDSLSLSPDCELSCSFEPTGWSNGDFLFSGSFSAREADRAFDITAKFTYSPGSGYFTLISLSFDSTAELTTGYVRLAATSDGSADLIGQPTGDGGFGSLMISWIFGNINLETERFVEGSSPELLLADVTGDGVDDLILRWYPNGRAAGSAAMCIEVFQGPTGAKRFYIDPIAEVSSNVEVTLDQNTFELKSRFGLERLELDAVSVSMDDLTIGKYVECELFGDRMLATLSLSSNMQMLDEKLIMVYKYSKAEKGFELESIFVSDCAYSLEAEDVSLRQIGKQRVLLISEGGLFEIAASESFVGAKLILSDLDRDGVKDPIVVLTVSEEPCREELYVLTSSSKRLVRVDGAADASELFSIDAEDEGFELSSRITSFTLSLEDFSSSDRFDRFDRLEPPKLDHSCSYSVENGQLICDIPIVCRMVGSDAYAVSSTTLRLTYKFDTVFKVASARPIRLDNEQLTMSFLQLSEYLEREREKGERNDRLTVTLTDHQEPMLEIAFHNGSARLERLFVSDQTLIPDEPLEMTGNIRFELFAAGDCVVVESLYYDLGDTYIITSDSILRSYSQYGQSADDYLVFSESDGRLCYKRIATRYNTIDRLQSPVTLLEKLTSRDDFYCETGYAEIIDGELSLTPEATQTISEVIDLDRLFDEYRESFSDCKSLDELIAHNLGLRRDEVINAEMSLTLADLKSELLRMLSNEKYTSLKATITDAGNAVLTIEKNDRGTELVQIEANASVFEPIEPIIFDDSPELTLFAAGNATAMQVLYVDGSRCRYVICADWVYSEHDTAIDAAECQTLIFPDGKGSIGYSRVYSAQPEHFFKTLFSRSQIFYESGRLKLENGIGYIVSESATYGETFDLDSEFEGVKGSFANFASLDQLISSNLDSIPTSYEYGGWKLKSWRGYYFLTDGKVSYALEPSVRECRSSLSTSFIVSGELAALVYPSAKNEQSVAILRLTDGELLAIASAEPSDFELLHNYSSKLTSIPEEYLLSCEVKEQNDNFVIAFELSSTENDLLLRMSKHFYSRSETLDSGYLPIMAAIGKKTLELLPYYERTEELFELLDVSSILCDQTHLPIMKKIDQVNFAYYYRITDERFEKNGISSVAELKALLSQVFTENALRSLDYLFEGELPYFIDSDDGICCLSAAKGAMISFPTFTSYGSTLFRHDRYFTEGDHETISSYSFVFSDGSYLLDSFDRPE